MATWNPLAPSSLGLEWQPTEAASSIYLGADTNAVAVAFTALTTRVITAIDLMAYVTAPGVVCLDLYTEANFLVAPDAISTANSGPTADINNGGIIDALPHWSKLDDNPLAGPDADYVTAPWGSYSYERERFGGLAVALGQRVLRVHFASMVALFQTTGGVTPPVARRLFMDDLVGTQFTFTATDPGVGLGWPVVTGEAKVNPTTRAPWLRSEMATWAAGATFGTEFSTSVDGQLRLYSHRVYADYATERRLAWATPTVAASSAVQRVQSGALILGSTGVAGNPTLTAGQRYVILIRRAPSAPAQWGSGPGPVATLALPWLRPTPPLVGYSMMYPPLDPYGRPWFGQSAGITPSILQTAMAGAVPAVTLVSATADLGDLNPYYDAQLFPIYGTTYAVLRQVVTATGVGTYGLVRAMVARGPDGTTLTARVRRRTDLVQMGGTATLTAAQWDLLPETGAVTVAGRMVKPVTFQLASTFATTAVDYFLDLESAAVSAPGFDWAALALVGNTAHSVASYGGAGFPALTYGGVVQTGTDAPTLLQVIPTAPASIIAPVVTVNWAESDDQSTLTAGNWDVVNVQWAATALGGTFARYEIERQEAGGAWVPIGRVTTEGGFPHFADYEGRRGVSTLYRVRVVRTDTAVSAWVTSSAAVPAAQGCTIGFVVNGTWENTYVSGVYQDLDELRTVQVLDQVVHRQMHARNYQVAFRQAERRGVQWGLTLLVYSGSGLPGKGSPVVAGTGLAQFDRLRAIARQEAPYVAVIDNEGGRIFASLAVPEVRRRPEGQVYYASVVATELTDVPTVHVRA